MATTTKASATPRLRFPEFRERTPWQVERMDQLYSFLPTNTFSRDQLNYERGVVKNVHYGDIHTKLPTLLDVSGERLPFVNSSEALPEDGSSTYCHEGDIVFADASEDLNDVGKSIEIVRLNGERLLSGQHTILARRNNNVPVVGFGGFLFRSELIRQQIRKEAQGTKVYGISPRRLANVEIAYPADEREQRKIVDCLASVDGVIRAQAHKVEALKAHKRGLMQQLFPREGETVPRRRFPAFRDAPGWAEATIGSRSETFSGGTPTSTNTAYYGGSIPFIRSAEIAASNTQLSLTDAGLKHSSARLVERGDVLVALYGANSGDVALSRIAGAINQAILCVRPDGSKDFLYHLLTARKSRILATYLQGGQGNLSGEIIKSLRVSFPLLDEQVVIARCLSEIDAVIEAHEESLRSLNTHKAGLMQQLFPSPDAD